jgi:hypothetical protein
MDGEKPKWQQVGYTRPADYDSSNFLAKISHSWGAELLQRGYKASLSPDDALPLLSAQDNVDQLVDTYSSGYGVHQAALRAKGTNGMQKFYQNGFLRTIIRSHASNLALHSFYAAVELAFRVLSPFALRQLVMWLQHYEDKKPGIKEGLGWLWACLVIVFGFGLVIFHHQLFWVGMRMGFQMRQQARPFLATFIP